MAGLKGKWGHVTMSGHSAYEVMSALQKAIRRGQEDLAMHWAYELVSCGRFYVLLNRLRVIAAEDVGMGDPEAVMYALQMIELADRWWRGKGEWMLGVANAILTLARAKKSRVADHFYWAVRVREMNGWNPDIPDEALDAHTQRGRQMGRGPRFFIEESSRLANEAGQVAVPDPYKAEFDAYWSEVTDQNAAEDAAFGPRTDAGKKPAKKPDEPELPEGNADQQLQFVDDGKEG
ncbi:MAG TPA: hypothetical protein VJU87_10765 [Gemmatimonadaceae bacterium]|nr:hypothetical protein [Gemmatimonadaceae bacterium]